MILVRGPDTGPIRGRTGELGILGEHLTAVGAGQGGVVLIEGAAGSGKSRLVSHTADLAGERGVRVAMATAKKAERLRPLAVVLRALGLLVTSPSGNVANKRPRLLEQSRAHLEDRVKLGPLLVVLDDLQWADTGSLFAIQTLTSQLGSYALLWVLAGRRDPADDRLDVLFKHLEQDPGAVPTRLDALQADAVAEIIADQVGAAPDADLLALAENARGNPFMVIELVDRLRVTGALETVDGRARLLASNVPSWLQVSAAGRLEGLTADSRRVLEVAAVLGETFVVDDLAEVLKEPVGRLLRPLREALDVGVLIPAGPALAFRHDLTHQEVYEGIPEALRVALHREIGELLLDRGGSAMPAAVHLMEGTRKRDKKALVGLDRATRELLAWWPSSAADVARRALDLTGATDDDRFARTLTAVHALVAASRVDEAIEVARTALHVAATPALAAADLRLTLSSLMFMRGQTSEATAEADAVLSQPDLPDRVHTAAALARLLGWTSQDNFQLGRQAAEAVLAGGERPDADAALGGALATLGMISWDEGQVAAALGHFRAAVRRADRGSDETRRNYPRLGLAVQLTAVGRFTEAERTILECRHEIERLGDVLWTAAPPIFSARLHAAAGRFDNALAEAQVGLAIAEEMGAHVWIPMASSVLATLALWTGDLDEAQRHISRYRAALPGGREGAFGSAIYDWIEFRLAAARNDAGGIQMLLARLVDALPAHKRLLVQEPDAAAWLVRVALRGGDRERAQTVVTNADQLAADNPDVPTVVASAAHARGSLNTDVDALVHAATHQAHHWAMASAAEDAGVLLAHRDHRAGREQLERALNAYQQIRADRDAARVRARLRRFGVATGRDKHRPTAGWDSLTETEEVVSRAVAEGLTNRQVADRMFLSHHTVDFHLRQIFRKLGINSRVQLTRLMLQHQRQLGDRKSRR